MQRLIALLSLAALAVGCSSVATGPASSASSILGAPNAASVEIHNQTDIRLSDANFVMLKTNVTAQTKGFALLGFITIVPARFQKAMNQLYAHSEIEPGKPQTLGNLIMEKSSLYLILFSIPRVSVRADVVQFVQPTAAIIVPAPSLPPETESKPNPSSSSSL